MYEKYLYALRAVESCFKYTENVLVIVEDAYSPYFKAPMFEEAKYIGKGSEVFIHRFPKHGDLTRSWNHGLRVARKKGVDYCVCGNIDIVFTKWLSNGLIHALNHGYDLVGPVSNAPGTTCPKGKAQIDKYYENYRVTDDPEYLNEVSVTLQYTQHTKVIAGPVNGFFQMPRRAFGGLAPSTRRTCTTLAIDSR